MRLQLGFKFPCVHLSLGARACIHDRDLSLSPCDVAHLDDPAAHLTLSHLTDAIDACVCCGVAVARRSKLSSAGGVRGC